MRDMKTIVSEENMDVILAVRQSLVRLAAILFATIKTQLP